LKWSDLHEPWQVCLEEAWQGYVAGSLPIGAAVVDDGGKVVSRGRNHIQDEEALLPGQFGQHKLAHAELNAILAIKNKIEWNTCENHSALPVHW